MNKLAVLLSLLVISACENAEVLSDRAIKQVTTYTVESPVTDGIRNMSARLAASQRVELSFRVPGKLLELRVREGDEVNAGDILAVLDQSEFRTDLDDRQAAFTNASNDYERAKKLIVDEAMSKKDYDAVVAEFRVSRAAYEQAKVQLEYTVLRSPFTGEISTRSVENFEEVAAGQQIFYVTDTSKMDVKFAVPESLMLMVRSRDSVPDDDLVMVQLKLADRPGETFPMEFREVAQRPDPATKTFEVTYQIDQLSDGLLLPGMTATAQVELFDLASGQFLIPTRLVYGDIYMQPHVWVLDEETMTVSSRAVSIGRNVGRTLAVTDGIEPGELLVRSHVAFLREGEKVALAGNP